MISRGNIDMEDRLELCDSEDDIAERITELLDIPVESAFKLLYFLDNNIEILSSDEELRKQETHQTGLVIMNDNYYINVKMVTIAFAALVIDNTFGNGVLSTIIALLGLPSKAVYRLNEEHGQKCILREVIRNRDHTGDCRILERNDGECVNNDLAACRFLVHGKCTCQSDDVKELMEDFAESGILKRISDTGFRYCW